MDQREAEMRYRIGAYLLGVTVEGAVRRPVVEAKLHYTKREAAVQEGLANWTPPESVK